MNRTHTCGRSDNIPQKATILLKTISPTTPSILLQTGRVGAQNEAFFEYIRSQYDRKKSTQNLSDKKRKCPPAFREQEGQSTSQGHEGSQFVHLCDRDCH